MTDPTGIPRLAALAVLGLSGEASAREITQAYRRLAKTTHPDVTGPLDHDAARRFAALADAYRVLTPNSISNSASPSGSRKESVPPQRPVPVVVRFVRSPVCAGPVRITPLPPISREPT